MNDHVTEKTVVALAGGMGLNIGKRAQSMVVSLNRQIDGFSVLDGTDDTITPMFDNDGGDKYKVKKDA